MIRDFSDYTAEKESVDSRYHEGGHGGVALHHDKKIVIRSKLTAPGEGVAKIIFPEGTPIEVKYDVAVAGCLSEAKQASTRKIDTDTDRMKVLANQISAELKKGEDKFKVEIPIVGDVIQQAACNPDDFDWLNGEPPSQDKLVESLQRTGKLLDEPEVWDAIDTIATILLKNGCFDSSKDRFWTEKHD